MKSNKRRCFFAYLAPRDMASFVKRDFEILQGACQVKAYMYSGGAGGVLDFICIAWGVLTSQFNFSWFAYRQAYWAVKLSRLMGRKSIVVLGGFDVCAEEDPALPARLSQIRFVLRNADVLLAVSERVRQSALSIEREARIQVIYHGFPTSMTSNHTEKKGYVVTVGYVRTANLTRKGLEVFVRAARFLPDRSFFLVGEWMDDAIHHLKSIAPDNVKFTGRLDDTKLLRLLGESNVYVQASLHEGFGCSLAEAMLNNCVPVVSDRGAIPEVVAETGVYVDPTNDEDVARGIRVALNRADLGPMARRRIVECFAIERRRKGLLEAISRLT